MSRTPAAVAVGKPAMQHMTVSDYSLGTGLFGCAFELGPNAILEKVSGLLGHEPHSRVGVEPWWQLRSPVRLGLMPIGAPQVGSAGGLLEDCKLSIWGGLSWTKPDYSRGSSR